MENKKYFYNVKTHCLHRYGFCAQSKSMPVDVKFFDIYDEALAFDGRSARFCKLCANKEAREESRK